MPVNRKRCSRGQEISRRHLTPLILSSLLLFLLGCRAPVMPEPPAVRIQDTPEAVLPETHTAARQPKNPTQEPTVELTVEPTIEPTTEPLSSSTPLPTSTYIPTTTPDPHLPPLDAVLGSAWQGPANGMDMVYVPGGSFTMGSDETNVEIYFSLCEQELGEGKCWLDWFDDEQPAHNIKLDDFWIQRTEVTNAQYAAFLGELGNQRENEVHWYDVDNPGAQIIEEDGVFRPSSERDNYPVAAVTWYGADAYCDWYGAQLPTEAQWEYAARGEASQMFPWGAAEVTCELAHYGPCGGQSIPADSLPQGASWTGAHNMAGNVWEWVSDWYDSGSYVTDEPENPLGPPLGKSKVLRGGGWESSSYDLRATNRSFGDPKFSADVLGFRCVVPGA